MKVEAIECVCLRISQVQALDPVTVVIRNLAPGEGSILIECYGEAWGAYWGAMGSSTLQEFFAKCDDHYLVNRFSKTALTKVKKAYLTRIVTAVQQALKEKI